MAIEQGNLSINSENFLPIIKKWLYTDKDIFIRELISNSCDAVNKLQKLINMGEADNVCTDTKYRITVSLDKDAKTISISDNGLGMTDEEIKKYINQIAFSGASDFMSKYGDKLDKDSEIIGHFGLGFYSAFMVADKVEIDSLSYQEGAIATKWVCDGGINYEMDLGTRAEHGTTITLHIGEDGNEFLDDAKMHSVINKYCAFMPVEIYMDVVGDETPDDSDKNEPIVINPVELEETIEKIKDDKASKDDDAQEKDDDNPKPLNETNPLWTRKPSDCTDEEYKDFYHKVFMDYKDPLFWIHLNMDYPFRLKGILYFPKLIQEMDAVDGQVKLFSNQVYIADNIKEVIPEFLLILKGVLDCPDLPLNVSRSTLQNDGYASQMSNYIAKKVADKLNKLFKNEREEYEKFFSDIDIFIKYGSMKEEKFYDKVKESIIFKTIGGKNVTLDEYLEQNKEKTDKKVFYVTDEQQQIQYINMFREQEMDAIILSAGIDKPFINFLDYKEESKLKLERIDAELSDSLKEEDSNPEITTALNEQLQGLFRGFLGKQKLNVKTESLKAKNISAMMLLDEQSRRMADMREMYSKDENMAQIFGTMETEETLVLNKNNRLVQLIVELKDKDERVADTELICHQLYDLALMGQKSLSSDEMSNFINRSNQILEKLAEYENK